MNSAAALTANQAADSDEQRTKRLFVGFLSSALGVDQTYSGEDGQASSSTGTYTIANPDGTYSVLGQPISNQNTPGVAAGIPPGFLLLVGLVLLLLR